AHTELVWNGSEVSYTCAHFSVVWAHALPDAASAAAASSTLRALPCVILVSSLAIKQATAEFLCLPLPLVVVRVHIRVAPWYYAGGRPPIQKLPQHDRAAIARSSTAVHRPGANARTTPP